MSAYQSYIIDKFSYIELVIKTEREADYLAIAATCIAFRINLISYSIDERKDFKHTDVTIY